VTKIDLTKTPGYPLNLLFAKNFQVLESVREDVILTAIARLHLWLRDDVEWGRVLGESIMMIELGLMDPSSVFIKKEPHPKRKVVEGRYRCINPVSLVDQLVESALFNEYSEILINNLYTCGSAVGIGFTDRQMKEFSDFVLDTSLRVNSRPVADDVRGFDSVHTFQTLMSTVLVDEFCVRIDGGKEAWVRANKMWVYCTCFSVAALGSRLYRKTRPGMLNSGSKDTSRRNTLLRLIYSYYFGISSGQPPSFALANGDDGLTWGINSVESYIEAAKDVGIEVRDVSRSNGNTLEFCSHKYDLQQGVAELTSWAKAVYRILTKPGMSYGDALQSAYEMRYNNVFLAVVHSIDDMFELRAAQSTSE
jgi:hypothetical protein